MSNREIKFRFFVPDPLGEEPGNMYYPDGWVDMSWAFLDYGEDCDIMQYTGLKDKNGKEIYEGDVVHLGGSINTVIEWGIHTKNKTYGHGDYGSSQCVGFYFDGWAGLPSWGTVIGNIYENPELIDG